MLDTSIFFFSHNVFYPNRNEVKKKTTHPLCVSMTHFSLCQSCDILTFSPFSPDQVFRILCGEKEKLLQTSNLSFSHNAFYTFGKLYAISIKRKKKLSSGNPFSLEESKICCLGKSPPPPPHLFH